MTPCLKTQNAASTVLVAEDDPLVRFVTVETLRMAGFNVIEAEDAADAIAYLARGNELDVLVTDVRMPGSIDGIELAVIVARRWPQVGILICSAHACPTEAELPPGAIFLAKPHGPGDLVDRVQGLIGTAPLVRSA